MTFRTVAGKTARGTVSTACIAGEVVRGVLLGLGLIWGVGYGISLIPRLEYELAFGWFSIAAFLTAVCVVLVFAAALVRTGAHREQIDCAVRKIFRTAAWMCASGMLAWIGQHAFELYEQVAPVPLWVDRVSEIAYFVAPAPAGIALYLLFVDDLNTAPARGTQAKQPELSQPGHSGRN